MLSFTTVSPSNIGQELDKLEELHKQNNQLRASLFNLVIFVNSLEKLPYFETLTHQITEKFPCRVLLIEENKEAPPLFLEALIAAKTIKNGEGPQVVCDYIHLKTAPGNPEQVLHLILEHLIPDLPLTLLWGQDPTCKHPLFDHLKQIAQRLIFHSECSNNIHDLAQNLLSSIVNCPWEVADLNWVYLEDWKKVIRTLFNSKENLDDLKNIETVNLNFCKTPSQYFCHNHFQVHYLHSWLASNLGWQFASLKENEQEQIITYKINDRLIQIHILQTMCDLRAPPGTILSVDLTLKNKKNFKFANQLEKDAINIEIWDEEKQKITYNGSIVKTKGEIYLSKEICYNETSAHYVEMLKTLSTIKGLI